jgi:ATP-dependent Lhr-like helicase
MAKTDHLQQMDDGVLLPGLAGEKIARAYDFYAVFASPPEVEVRAGDRSLGKLPARVQVGACFLFAGQVWCVREVYKDEVRVEPAPSGTKPSFGGVGGPPVHPRVAAKAREVLCGTAEYPYLPDATAKRLAAARARSKQMGMDRRILFEGDVLLPWLGSEGIEALAELFAWAGVGVESSKPPWILDLKGDVRAAAKQILARPPSGAELAAKLERETLATRKFDEHLPDELLRRRHAEELALDAALDCLRALA